MSLSHSLPLLEVRSQAEGLVTGYASVFGGIDSYGDQVARGAFRDSLANHRAKGTAPVMLWSHKADTPIGRWIEMNEDARGLQVTGQINLKTTAGQQAFEHLRAGDVTGLSIGYRVTKGGSQMREGVNVLTAIDLAEISVVSVPADSAARISAVKTAGIKPATVRDLEEALAQIGFSRREAKAVASKGFAGFAEPDDSIEIIAALKAATQQFTKASQ
ncbi:HK97 family phage prohead protease [Massilia sp. DJPM01]|uniref:HK97 family phage prohead protease n=1 Tax=Massilia sp. DJPM01 TaxID=3024404 RepID=UPI00259E675E|nr:HK97 family phage prohead protease [Massilia sp. DJPM01]MDM5176570.1 HK97 family phage prohead protease [Massilia sp. DJPM01]